MSSWRFPSFFEGTIFHIDSITKEIHKHIEKNRLTLRNFFLGTFFLVIGYRCCSMVYIAIDHRKKMHGVLKKGYESLRRPEMYPKYVPHTKMIDSIKSACTSDGGVQILWGISGSGKSTYLKEALRELVNGKEINGCIFVEPLNIQFSVDNDGGSTFLNKVLRVNILPANEIFSHFLDRTFYDHGWLGYFLRWKGIWDAYDTKKKTVLVFDQFDNYVPHSDEKSLNRSLDSWLRNLAEQSNKTNKLIVLIATTDENFALRLHNLNNRVKFKYVDHCREFKWTKHEVLSFFNLVNVTLDDQQCDTATKAGTPDFCANYLKYLNGRRYVLPDPTASAEILDRAREDGRKIAFA